MSIRNTRSSYGSVAILFHWLIFILVAIMIPLGYFMGDIPDEAMRGQAFNFHKVLGVCILILMLMRVSWAFYSVKPGLPFQTPLWQRVSERCVHFLLYAGLIVMPLSGLIGSVAAGRPPHIYGINIELPISLNKAVASFAFKEIHEPLAIILIVLICIHILAALYHHFIKRDDILRRMMGSERKW